MAALWDSRGEGVGDEGGGEGELVEGEESWGGGVEAAEFFGAAETVEGEEGEGDGEWEGAGAEGRRVRRVRPAKRAERDASDR